MPRYNTRFDIFQRLESDPTYGCTLWMGSCRTNGYGQVYWHGKNVRVHRLVWEWTHGPIPPDKILCHRCESFYPPGDLTYRRCTRLDHLYVGTAQTNADDRHVNGRMRPPRGDAHWTHRCEKPPRQGGENPQAKLTDEQVREIRERLAHGAIGRRLGWEYGVSAATISMVKNGQRWAHLL